MSNHDSSDTPYITALKNKYDSIMAKMGSYATEQEMMDDLGRIKWICNEIQCEHHPKLRGRICECCKEKFDGHGNNPHPLPYKTVCDACNANYVIPARIMGFKQKKVGGKKTKKGSPSL